ncbi:unnamed protein product [Lathyrus sativus]|nr:unnamed protein product [Lathyrus sativus]
MLTLGPCGDAFRHVVSAMQYQNFNPETFVDPCYMREAYKICYENNVSPINGMDMWHAVDVENMFPHQYKKGPSRPKKLRFREQDESGSRIKRHGVAYRCTKCDKFGHNLRKCQSKEQDPNALKRKKKTPRTKASSSAAKIEGNTETNVGESVSEMKEPHDDNL